MGTLKRLDNALATAIVIINIIVITAVITVVITAVLMMKHNVAVIAVLISTNNIKSDQVVEGAPIVASNVTQAMTTTKPPSTTTFGPAVIGNFEGTFAMNITYGDFFDDVRAQLTIVFKKNFTEAMDEVYNVPSAAQFMYQGAYVDQLERIGTYVQVKFTVSLDAINRGGRGHLVTTLGSCFPSKALNTYPVLYADIEPEKDPSLSVLENP